MGRSGKGGRGSRFVHQRVICGVSALVCSFLFHMSAGQEVFAEVVRLDATADIWLSNANEKERNSSSGKVKRFKLKSIQEMAAIRFDVSPIMEREVLSARIFLHRAGDDMLRYVRLSTVSQDWTEGDSRRAYGKADGATYRWADVGRKKAWSYAGSEFADVIMGMGHSITTYAEMKEEGGGWISVEITPDLIYAMTASNTDGLAVMEGGTIALFNNFVHSVQSGRYAPYILVEAGAPLAEKPVRPKVTVKSAPKRARLGTGAIEVSIEESLEVFCWKLKLDGVPVPRWKVPWPRRVRETGREQGHISEGRGKGAARIPFVIDNLAPDTFFQVEVTAVSRTGARSRPAVLDVQSSQSHGKPPPLGSLEKPEGRTSPVRAGSTFSLWAVPGLVKISPEKAVDMFGGMAGDGRGTQANAVWDGKAVRLAGARGEYVSFQLVVEKQGKGDRGAGYTVKFGPLEGPEGIIGKGEIELFKNWYARNEDGQWQPAYTIPMEQGELFEIPDSYRGLRDQKNQTVYVDVYIPGSASAGNYEGRIEVVSGEEKGELPVLLEVFDFELPDELSFWPELNSYSVPPGHLEYHRLAHRHRSVFNPWRYTPETSGSGENIHVSWDRYDETVGPFLTGEAFADERRKGVPTPCMYLPFKDNWPTPLSKETYDYQGHWPGMGEDREHIVDHYMTAPYIGNGLSKSYMEAFNDVQGQFVEHFREKRWNRTEMQCFFGGKNTHRINYGSNLWWTTDEPAHWDDWLALQFFANLWSEGRKDLDADSRIWAFRADISRPMWTGRTLDAIMDRVYWGRFEDPRAPRRWAWLSENTGLESNVYGSVRKGTESNLRNVEMLVNAWLKGSNGFLNWWSVGNDQSLDDNDNVGGAPLLVPGKRFGHPVVADMRLKALRDGQQLVEYLTLLADRKGLTREQVGAILQGSSALDGLTAWQFAGIRRRLAERIVAKEE